MTMDTLSPAAQTLIAHLHQAAAECDELHLATEQRRAARNPRPRRNLSPRPSLARDCATESFLRTIAAPMGVQVNFRRTRELAAKRPTPILTTEERNRVQAIAERSAAAADLRVVKAEETRVRVLAKEAEGTSDAAERAATHLDRTRDRAYAVLANTSSPVARVEATKVFARTDHLADLTEARERERETPQDPEKRPRMRV